MERQEKGLDEFIERRIVTGMIVSDEYIKEISKKWQPKLLESATAKLLATWCMEFFEKYNRAPNRDIEGIFEHKRNGGGLPAQRSEDVEEVLAGLSEEYEREQFNVPYLLDQTKDYLRIQKLKKFTEQIQNTINMGGKDALVEAEQLACGFSPLIGDDEYKAINPFESAQRIRKAFEERQAPLLRFPTRKSELKVLGQFINDQLTRDAFVAFMGAEKKGKTFTLMELGMRAMASGCNVAFFQAGDMTEDQMLRRLCIYLSERSDLKKYCKEMWKPIVDCIKNQDGSCSNRESQEEGMEHTISEKKTMNEIVQIVQKYPKHRTCYNCDKIQGTIWLEKISEKAPLTWKDAAKKAREWQEKHAKNFKLCTYPNETLTIAEIRDLLDIWEKREAFVPDVIIIDYADILAPDPDCRKLDYRHQQNKLWQRLRRLSQQRHCLVVTATQSDAASYEVDTLKMKHFSETKTKYAHVTAMYGLNQNPEEKKIGIMRLNAIVIRDDDFSITDQITILQRLQIGKPFLGSYR